MIFAYDYKENDVSIPYINEGRYVSHAVNIMSSGCMHKSSRYCNYKNTAQCLELNSQHYLLISEVPFKKLVLYNGHINISLLLYILYYCRVQQLSQSVTSASNAIKIQHLAGHRLCLQ